jgi:hypothetical protein
VSAPRYKREQHAIIGAVALFYARSFPYTIMFAQAFRVTGWPVVKEGLAKLSIEFEKGRDELSRQGLSFADAKNVLSNYRWDMTLLKSLCERDGGKRDARTWSVRVRRRWRGHAGDNSHFDASSQDAARRPPEDVR